MPHVLRLPIGALAELLLHRRCDCHMGYSGAMSVRLLLRQHSRCQPLGDLLPRMVCKVCRRPAAVLLSDSFHITLEGGGPPPGWSVVLSNPKGLALGRQRVED